MEQLIKMLNSMLESGSITESSLLLIILIILFGGFKYIIEPMRKKIDLLATSKNIEELKKSMNLDDLLKKFDNIAKSLSDVECVDKENNKELDDLKRDLEHIKQLLNQFHGHLIYNAERRAAYFGNKELK